jgi:hypothetical protein
MTPMTEEEWQRVQEALVKGGLRECVDSLLARRPYLSIGNRKIIEQAYDDGDGNNIRLVVTDRFPWFLGMWEDSVVYRGLECRGTLYSIVMLNGDDRCTVIIGDGLVTNEIGVAFQSVDAATAYVEGITAK